MTVSRYRTKALHEGYLQLFKPHRFRPHGQGVATEFRYCPNRALLKDASNARPVPRKRKAFASVPLEPHRRIAPHAREGSPACGVPAHVRLEKRLALAQNMVQTRAMDTRFVIEKLRRHERELKASGILHLRVFGSVAREEASSLSDVDLLADFDKSRRITLVNLGSLQGRLSHMLGARVDLSSTDWMREPVKSKALREAVIVF